MKVALLVTHLLGTGHLKRAGLLADGFAAAGHDVVLLSGGMSAPNAAPVMARVEQLPPLRAADASFALVDAQGEAAGETVLCARRAAIEAALGAFGPDLLITELFPFGRRKLAEEFETAIAAAKEAMIFCSIRDILQRPRKPGRVEEAEDRFARLYDGAFVHGDDALAPLSASWPLPGKLRRKLHMTGYVGERPRPDDRGKDGVGEIIVAAGGGAVGDRLFAAAVDAQAEHMDGRLWRLLVGGHDGDDRIAALRERAGDCVSVMIEPVRRDFRSLLSRCDLAILQCGYNSAMDVVATGARALFCPFEESGEMEQRIRAEAFAARFGSGVIAESTVSGPALARAAEAVLASARPDYSGVRLGGVETTVRMAEEAMRARHRR